MQSTQVEGVYTSELAVSNPLESPDAAAPLSALTDLEQLIDQELSIESFAASCMELPIGPDEIAQEAELLRRKQLSSDLTRWVDIYGQVGDRTPYLWTWCHQAAEATTLPCVSSDWHDELCDTKLLGIVFLVLLDDVADRGGDEEFLERLVGLTHSDKPSCWRSFTNREQEYAAICEEMWDETQRRIERFPRYAEYADVLRFDYLQLMNAMRYSHFLNRFPCFLNLAEHDLYMPHNMMMMICATMDMMCSPEFDFSEAGRIRQATWHAQHMGRIGNLITTWEREIHEQDYTSGVFARALIQGDLTLEQLASGDPEFIEHTIRDGQHEQYFLNKWCEHREQILALRASVRSVDLGCVVNGLDRLICLHFASRGLK